MDLTDWLDVDAVLRKLEETRARQRKAFEDEEYAKEYAVMEAAAHEDLSDEDCSDLG